MGFINLSEKTINAKLVYYGVGLGGKTTSLKVVHGMLCPNDEVKLVSINTEQDSTLLFDFLPIDLGNVEGFKIRVQGFTVPGQAKYVVMRKYVLQGADAVVLVVDSRKRLIEDNLQAIEDLKVNLEANGLDWQTIPLVIQYNKRDLPDLLDRDELDQLFRFRDVPVFETIAPDGVGVYEAFTDVVAWMVEEKVRQYGLGRGRVSPEVVASESRAKLLAALADAPPRPKVAEGLVRLAVPSKQALPYEAVDVGIEAKSSDADDREQGPPCDDGSSLAHFASHLEAQVEDLFAGDADTPLVDTHAALEFTSEELSSIEATALPAPACLHEALLAASSHHTSGDTDTTADLLGQAIHSNLELAELYSELAEYKSRLEKKNRELVEANQLIAHDLKKPLTVFKSVLHLLEKELLGPLTDKQRDAIENCVESVGYMEDLVGDILDSSRLDYDGLPFDFEDIDLTTLVSGIVRRLRYDVEKTGVKIHVDGLPLVRGDRSAFTKIFMNLLGNAIHYRDAKKESCEVHVRCRDDEDRW
ncbi:MAG TPA: histidine kinase dimerization/phospho-acceptor domain-containing protein, partial [Planctomycetota bacterium]|nr:histidine kinase dimerization/phospho-acceptor domain-containing protein [Planctomycetota bacterium]